MAYFDSARNREIWQKELDALEKERERRAREGYPTGTDQEPVQGEDPDCVPMTYAELEQEEAKAQGERDLRFMKEKRERWKEQGENERAVRKKDMEAGRQEKQ